MKSNEQAGPGWVSLALSEKESCRYFHPNWRTNTGCAKNLRSVRGVNCSGVSWIATRNSDNYDGNWQEVDVLQDS